MKGMALAFAQALCEPGREDVQVASTRARGIAGGRPESSDALAWYEDEFRALGMANQSSGADTLRHTYTLLIGLGMRESSGRYCLGRDRSADFNTADSAEAGLFQTSWGASRRHPSLPRIFERFRADRSSCMVEAFAENVRCGEWDQRDWGSGTGVEWQNLTKGCPAFAAQYASVVLRAHGGSGGEFGPIRRKQAELRPECNEMLLAVQQIVEANEGICAALLTAR
jgi:hypothetical protein